MTEEIVFSMRVVILSIISDAVQFFSKVVDSIEESVGCWGLPTSTEVG